MQITKAGIITLLITAWISVAAETQDRNPYTPFNSKSEYEETVKTLGRYIDCFGKRRINRIWIARIQNDDGKKYLYGYWKDGQSILLLNHFIRIFDGNRERTDYYWLNYKARINLRTDVVPTEEDIGGSTYLVDQPWAANIVGSCLKKGRKIVILKHGRKTSCKSAGVS